MNIPGGRGDRTTDESACEGCSDSAGSKWDGRGMDSPGPRQPMMPGPETVLSIEGGAERVDGILNLLDANPRPVQRGSGGGQSWPGDVGGDIAEWCDVCERYHREGEVVPCR